MSTTDLSDRLLIFRKWRPSYASEYTYYYAGIPGQPYCIIVRKSYTEKSVLPYETLCCSIDSMLSVENEPATEEEFKQFYLNAVNQNSTYMKRMLRPID
jgi:hypothetical protein